MPNPQDVDFDQPAVSVQFTPVGRMDPYPAVIEALGQVFAFAADDAAHIGVLGGGEPAIVQEMYQACKAVLEKNDRHSVRLLGEPRFVTE